MRHIRDNSKPYYIKGQRITFHVPYEGDPRLFRVNPAVRGGGRPKGQVSENEIVLSYDIVDHDVAKVKSLFDADVANIQELLRCHESRVPNHNDTIKRIAKGKFEFRKQKILKDQGLVASLGYPLRKREGAPQTYIAPVARKQLQVFKPSVTTTPFVPEPELAMEQYEHILSVISNMVAVIERSPATFQNMEEEALRQHFLVQLNGQYEGQATGETFNFEGKTDILIRHEGKNIFIAECKVWHGPKALLETIDQLLGYVSWRDTKTAILLFNRNKNLTAVLDQIPGVIAGHPNFKRRVPYDSETAFRFVVHHRDDSSRDMMLTVLVFEVSA